MPESLKTEFAGKDLYEKLKMKKNKKYLYKLLQQSAMTTKPTEKPESSTSDLNFKRDIEKNINMSNDALDRYLINLFL